MDRLPCFILIDRALRDEGTSYHYMPPADFSAAPAHLLHALCSAFGSFGEPVLQGATWTTDAPFRETAAAIDAITQRGLLARRSACLAGWVGFHMSPCTNSGLLRSMRQSMTVPAQRKTNPANSMSW